MTIEEIINKINSENDFGKQYLAINRYYSGYYIDRERFAKFSIHYSDNELLTIVPNRLLCTYYMTMYIVIKEKSDNKSKVLFNISPTGLRHFLYGKEYKTVKKKMMYVLHQELSKIEDVEFTNFPFELNNMEIVKNYEIDGKYLVNSESLKSLPVPFTVSKIVNEYKFGKIVMNDIFPKMEIISEIETKYKNVKKSEKKYSY